jgi:hypothetical protein
MLKWFTRELPAETETENNTSGVSPGTSKERVGSDFEQLEKDAHAISFPKSGRTWLSQLYYQYYTHLHSALLEEKPQGKWRLYYPEKSDHFVTLLQQTRQLGKPIPVVGFSHLTPGRGALPYYEISLDIQRLGQKPILYLSRDPRDVVVSYYHHVMSKEEFRLAKDVSLSEFLRSELFGIRYIVAYCNYWAEQLQKGHPNLKFVTYESLQNNPVSLLEEILLFWGAPSVEGESLSYAVQATQFERLKAEENKRREAQGKEQDDKQMRMRKGKVGGYKEELNQEDIVYINRVIKTHLHPYYESYLC